MFSIQHAEAAVSLWHRIAQADDATFEDFDYANEQMSEIFAKVEAEYGPFQTKIEGPNVRFVFQGGEKG